MGIYIDKHFSPIGGFSTRRQANEFVTVLPYSDLSEAESILQEFVKDLQDRGIKDVWLGAQREAAPEACIEFAILAGIAQGQPIAEIDAVINEAKDKQKEVARFRCSRVWWAQLPAA